MPEAVRGSLAHGTGVDGGGVGDYHAGGKRKGSKDKKEDGRDLLRPSLENI